MKMVLQKENEEVLDGTVGGAMDAEHTTKENAQEEAFNPQAAIERLNAEPELKKFVVTQFEKMKKLEAKRSALNDELKAARSKIETKGIPIESIKMAFKLYKMDLTQMQESIIGMALCMKATDQPVQIDFLETASVTNIH